MAPIRAPTLTPSQVRSPEPAATPMHGPMRTVSQVRSPEPAATPMHGPMRTVSQVCLPELDSRVRRAQDGPVRAAGSHTCGAQAPPTTHGPSQRAQRPPAADSLPTTAPSSASSPPQPTYDALFPACLPQRGTHRPATRPHARDRSPCRTSSCTDSHVRALDHARDECACMRCQVHRFWKVIRWVPRIGC